MLQLDRTKAWVGTSYLGYTGSHHCTVNYAVGVTITLVSCSESGATSYRNMYYGYNVTVQFITYGYSATATVKSNGTATGFGVTY